MAVLEWGEVRSVTNFRPTRSTRDPLVIHWSTAGSILSGHPGRSPSFSEHTGTLWKNHFWIGHPPLIFLAANRCQEFGVEHIRGQHCCHIDPTAGVGNPQLSYGGFLTMVPPNHPFSSDFPLKTKHFKGTPPCMETQWIHMIDTWSLMVPSDILQVRFSKSKSGVPGFQKRHANPHVSYVVSPFSGRFIWLFWSTLELITSHILGSLQHFQYMDSFSTFLNLFFPIFLSVFFFQVSPTYPQPGARPSCWIPAVGRLSSCRLMRSWRCLIAGCDQCGYPDSWMVYNGKFIYKYL